MRIEEFTQLSYNEQLKVIRSSGKLKHSEIVNDTQVTLYKVKNFYVELTRNIKELFFEKIAAIAYDDLPAQYKEHSLHKEPW